MTDEHRQAIMTTPTPQEASARVLQLHSKNTGVYQPMELIEVWKLALILATEYQENKT